VCFAQARAEEGEEEIALKAKVRNGPRFFFSVVHIVLREAIICQDRLGTNARKSQSYKTVSRRCISLRKSWALSPGGDVGDLSCWHPACCRHQSTCRRTCIKLNKCKSQSNTCSDTESDTTNNNYNSPHTPSIDTETRQRSRPTICFTVWADHSRFPLVL